MWTRDSALWWVIICGALATYFASMPAPTSWTWAQWMQTIAAAAGIIAGKLATSPLQGAPDDNRIKVPPALRLLVVLALAGSLTGCAHVNRPPQSFSAIGQQAWWGTQVIRDLDVLRDTVVDANAQTPPLISTQATRQIVQFHQSAITLVHTRPLGWTQTILTGLSEVPKHLSVEEQTLVTPYLQLIAVVLAEVL